MATDEEMQPQQKKAEPLESVETVEYVPSSQDIPDETQQIDNVAYIRTPNRNVGAKADSIAMKVGGAVRGVGNYIAEQRAKRAAEQALNPQQPQPVQRFSRRTIRITDGSPFQSSQAPLVRQQRSLIFSGMATRDGEAMKSMTAEYSSPSNANPLNPGSPLFVGGGNSNIFSRFGGNKDIIGGLGGLGFTQRKGKMGKKGRGARQSLTPLQRMMFAGKGKKHKYKFF